MAALEGAVPMVLLRDLIDRRLPIYDTKPFLGAIVVYPYEKYYNTTAILLQYVNKILAKI